MFLEVCSDLETLAVFLLAMALLAVAAPLVQSADSAAESVCLLLNLLLEGLQCTIHSPDAKVMGKLLKYG